MLTREDIAEIKLELDDRYVMQATCNETMRDVNKRFAADDKRIEVILHDFKIVKYLVTTVATSSIGALVVSVIELLTK